MFYYPNKKKQQSLNEKYLSSDSPTVWGICQQVENTINVENPGV